ncbi:MAG: hypothetical protein K8L99_28550 [Anaerolineae bacterium]|nr:hypothetical protein [Anaerolineae bacterium]
MTQSSNYPDILGYITDGARYNLNVVQLALGVRPRVVRAGRPFEAILLVQNASNVNVDLGVQLALPERDAKKQRGMFTARNNRLMIGLRPAEVGYIKLPIGSQPDTAVDNGYCLGMEVKVKPLEKPERIRSTEGGGPIPFESLPEAMIASLDELKKLVFSTDKRFGLRDALEASFSVMPGRLGQIADLQAGWVNLWSMSDHIDQDALIRRYSEVVTERVLPQLKPKYVLDLLLEETNRRFEAAGFPLKPVEALCISGLLAHILDMASPKENVIDYLENPVFNVKLGLEHYTDSQHEEPVAFPAWFEGFLRVIARNEELINVSAKVVSKMLYVDLLRDAIPHAFAMVKTITGEDIGSDAEIDHYRGQLIMHLDGQPGMDFTRGYMPLILGGTIIYDRISVPDQDFEETLRDLGSALEEREPDLGDEDLFVRDMAKGLINRNARQFGFQI